MDTHLALTKFLAAHAARPAAPAMDATATTAQHDGYADLRAAIAQDAEWNEESHPRNSKGGSSGGRFRTSGKTIEREDSLNWYGEPDDKKIEVPDDIIDSVGKTKVVNENIELLKRAASSKHTDKDVLEKLAHTESYTSSNANCEIQEAVAANPSTSTDTLKFLAGWPTQNEDGIERESDHQTAKRYNTSAVSRNAKKQLVDRGLKRYGISYDAAINWQSIDHPREAAGGGHGGEFAKKPETLLREDARDTLSKTEGQTAINASVERGLADIAKNAGPVGTSAKADIFKEFGKPVAAIRLVKNDRERFTGAELSAMIKALSEAGCENVEAEQDSDRRNEAVIFCSPPVDPDSAAESYMSEVEKTVAASSGTSDYTPTEEALESAREMAKNTDAQNPAKRIRVDFQEWTYEDGLKGEPSVVGKEEDASDGKAFNSPEDAGKWLLKTKNAGSLEGDPSWFSTVTQKGGKWRTYRLTPVNFTEQEILEIDRIVSKGDKE